MTVRMEHIDHMEQLRIGRSNIRALYAFTVTSHLWFDGGLWVIYFQHRGLSLFDIGLLEALLHIVAVLSDVPVGAIADRFGWKLSLALGTLLGVGYTLTALFSANLWWIAGAFAARGLQVTLTNGSDAAIAYESAVWAQRVHEYRALSGRLLAAGLVSLGIAEALGGVLAHGSWPAVYVAFTLTNLASFVSLLWIKEPRAARVSSSEPPAHPSTLTILRQAARFAASNRPFVQWIVLSGTLFGFIATFGFYGQSLLLHSGWTLVGIGILMGIENGVGAVAATLSDRLTRRWGERRAVTAIGILTSTGLILFAWLPGVFTGVGYLLDSMAGNLADPIINHGLNSLVPSEQRATLLSANSTAFSLFMIIGFPLFGALANHSGLVNAAHVGSVVGALCLLGIIAWWSTGRRE